MKDSEKKLLVLYLNTKKMKDGDILEYVDNIKKKFNFDDSVKLLVILTKKRQTEIVRLY